MELLKSRSSPSLTWNGHSFLDLSKKQAGIWGKLSVAILEVPSLGETAREWTLIIVSGWRSRVCLMSCRMLSFFSCTSGMPLTLKFVWLVNSIVGLPFWRRKANTSCWTRRYHKSAEAKISKWLVFPVADYKFEGKGNRANSADHWDWECPARKETSGINASKSCWLPPRQKCKSMYVAESMTNHCSSRASLSTRDKNSQWSYFSTDASVNLTDGLMCKYKCIVLFEIKLGLIS